MGQVHSTNRVGLVFSTRPDRCWVQQYKFCGTESHPPLITGGGESHNQQISIKRHDDRPLAFTQDPQTQYLVAQVPYAPDLRLKAKLHVPQHQNHETNYRETVYSQDRGSSNQPNGPNDQTSQTRHNEWMVAFGTSVEELLQAVKLTNRNHVALSPQGEVHLRLPVLEQLGGYPVHFAIVNTLGDVFMGASIWVCERPAFEMNTQMLAELQSPVDTPAPRAFLSPNTAPPSNSTTPGSTGTNSSNGPVVIPTPATNSPDLILSPRKQRDASVRAARPRNENYAHSDDGPQFRASLNHMERQMPQLKARAKNMLKKALNTREKLSALVSADEELALAVYEAAKTDFPALKPIADWFNGRSNDGLSAIQRARKVVLNELTTRVVEPLQQLYDCDIRSFESRKREFDEYSSQFYSWTSRYLAKDGRRGESADSKFAAKKRAFDAARIAYFMYLNELCGGLKQQILLQLMSLAAQSLTDLYVALGSELNARTRPHIDETIADIRKAAKEWESYRFDGVEKIRSLSVSSDGQNASPSPPPTPLNASNSVDNEKNEKNDGNMADSSMVSNSSTKSRQITKEGLLWACNRPYPDAQTPQPLQNKWHKYWIVQDGCWLREYSNWKQSVDLHNEPINLKAALVRETTAVDRRFCFEIVTPYYRRVYQATSEEDQRAWIASISQGIANVLGQETVDADRGQRNFDRRDKGTLDASSSYQEPIPSSNRRSLQFLSSSQRTGNQSNQSNQSNHLSNSNGSTPSSSHTSLPSHGSQSSLTKTKSTPPFEQLTRKISLKKDRPRVPPLVTTLSQSLTPPALSSALSSAHVHAHAHAHGLGYSNSHTHGTTPTHTPVFPKTDDALFHQVQQIPSDRMCAECSSTKSVEWVSINLLMVLCIDCSGAHRSLGSHISKVRSLTLDVGAFTPSLRSALLSVSNACLNNIWEELHPPTSKLAATASPQARLEFITEKYVEKRFVREIPKPNTALRKAIAACDIPSVCAALASRANPNAVSDDGEPMLVLALRCEPDPETSVFPSAEILIKNGATVPPPDAQYVGLTKNALLYLEAKRKQP